MIVVATGTRPREVSLPLLDQLWLRDPPEAARFQDAWALVIEEIRVANLTNDESRITDPQMVNDCLLALSIRLAHVAPKGMTFERRGDRWGFWKLDAEPEDD